MKINWKQGYIRMSTVAMSIAVLALAAVCVFIFLGYTRTSYMVKADSTAEKVYHAAQDYISAEKEYGRLDEFNEQAKRSGKALSMELQQRILKANYTGDDVDEKIKEYVRKYKEGEIRYLVVESEAAASDNRGSNLIFQLFKNQITDEKLWKDTYLIEYDSKRGEVLSVFYSRKTDKFRYDGETKDKSNVIDRSEKLLKEKQQGYFGVSLDEILD